MEACACPYPQHVQPCALAHHLDLQLGMIHSRSKSPARAAWPLKLGWPLTCSRGSHEGCHHVPPLDLARGGLGQLVGEEDLAGHLPGRAHTKAHAEGLGLGLGFRLHCTALSVTRAGWCGPMGSLPWRAPDINFVPRVP